MIKGFINSLVSKHDFDWELWEHVPEDKTNKCYDVLNDKLEALKRDGNLTIFNGFYTEYLDGSENVASNKQDDKYVIKNCLYQN